MFRITVDPSSGSLVQCLVKNYCTRLRDVGSSVILHILEHF